VPTSPSSATPEPAASDAGPAAAEATAAAAGSSVAVAEPGEDVRVAEPAEAEVAEATEAPVVAGEQVEATTKAPGGTADAATTPDTADTAPADTAPADTAPADTAPAGAAPADADRANAAAVVDDAPAGTETAAPDKPARRHAWRSLGRRPQAATGAGAHARAERFNVASLFRLPGTHDPSPDNGQLIGICAWAMALGVVGLLIALRGLVGIVSGHAPTWYEPTLIGTGMVGILFTVLAFLTIQRRYLPWIMLAVATIPLGVNIGLTVAAF
jgi:hypothetical protein